ncbi:hypothetical protein [Acidisoma sp. L85]|uniref:hypothetical protein n=1 Tax=Acidisoma sp. L85 TaxID=1641850 RepID=UPI00131C9CA8|nr:hypothetical protein [Acidisoma sp. L85]
MDSRPPSRAAEERNSVRARILIEGLDKGLCLPERSVISIGARDFTLDLLYEEAGNGSLVYERGA